VGLPREALAPTLAQHVIAIAIIDKPNAACTFSAPGSPDDICKDRTALAGWTLRRRERAMRF
jgi:hypothetical protein